MCPRWGDSTRMARTFPTRVTARIGALVLGLLFMSVRKVVAFQKVNVKCPTEEIRAHSTHVNRTHHEACCILRVHPAGHMLKHALGQRLKMTQWFGCTCYHVRDANHIIEMLNTITC